MRFESLAAVFAVATIAAACNNRQPAPTASAPKEEAVLAASVAPTPDASAIRGTVAEKIDAGQYSYLKLKTPGGEVWTAVLKSDKKVGDPAAVVGANWMENFKSATLNRTWPRIAFGSLEDSAPAAAKGEMSAGQPGAGPGAGMFAREAAGKSALPPGHPAPDKSADLGAVKVSRASGPQGRTIADIYAQSAQLKDRPISVHGKVVKATNGVMGKNWLHLRDGTGQGATSDLTVASDQTAGVGDTVLVSGTVHLNRDLGAGYHYDVLVEDAQVKGD